MSGIGAGPMRAVALAALAAVVLFAGMAAYVAPLEPNVLVLQFAFTPRAFATIVHAWPPEHLARYRAHLPVDTLFLFAYGAFGWLVATRTALFAPLPPALRRVGRWSLPLAAALDAAENALHWWLTAAPRFDVPWLYPVSAWCSTAKWLLAFAFGGLALVGLALARDER